MRGRAHRTRAPLRSEQVELAVHQLSDDLAFVLYLVSGFALDGIRSRRLDRELQEGFEHVA